MDNRINLTVAGLSCDGCSNRVKTALESLEGVQRAEVDHNTGLAEISVSDNVPEADLLIEAVAKIGYTAKIG